MESEMQAESEAAILTQGNDSEMVADLSRVEAAAPSKKLWKTGTLLAIAAALVSALFAIAIDQEYFRYNFYALPVLGLVAASLYIACFCSIPAVRKYGREIYLINPRIGVGLGVFLLVMLLGGMIVAFRAALAESKAHVDEGRREDANTRIVQSVQTSSLRPAAPYVYHSPKAETPENQRKSKRSSRQPGSSPFATVRPSKTTSGQPAPTSNPQSPSASAPVSPPIINYAPGGFATSGGYLDHPTINTRPPPPEFGLYPPQLIDAEPIYPRLNGSGAPDTSKLKIGTTHPGVSITVELKGVFANPAFIADCSVPCQLVEQTFVENGFERVSGDYTAISTPDHMVAGASINVNQLSSGAKIGLKFESLSDKPLSISNVKPYVP